MAINQEALARSITPQTANVSAPTGFDRLGEATAQVGQLITNKLNEIAIDKAQTQGAMDAESGQAPEKLLPNITKATKAYNTAVAETESNRMLLSAQQLINESLINSKNPATFNPNTPAEFKASLEGIKEGIIGNARPEYRAQLSQHIDRMSASAQLNMLQHSIEYDNTKTKNDFNYDLEGLLEARRNAVISGDESRVAGIDSVIDSTINNYSEMNHEIALSETKLRKALEQQKQVDGVLAQFAHALESKTSGKFLADLEKNPDKLPFNVWSEAVKGVVALDQTHTRLLNEQNGLNVAQVKEGIKSGQITNPEDLLNYDLSNTQAVEAMGLLRAQQEKKFSDTNKMLTAQQNILNNRPSWNTPKQVDEMFQSAVKNFELASGRVATIKDMEQIALGKSDFPASGIKGIPMGRNIPALDSAMSLQLTSKNPIMTAMAAGAFKNMTQNQEQPNSVDISGDALAVATLYNQLNQGGIAREEAANTAIRTVIDKTEPEVQQRIERFNKVIAKTNPKTGQQDKLRQAYRTVFGSYPQDFGSDEAFRTFVNTYRAQYIAGSSEAGALDATKYEMRSWGTSKYFDKGYVGNVVPEKEIPVAKVAYAFDNQFSMIVQNYIDHNDEYIMRHPELNLPKIEWANKDDHIGDPSQDDMVFKKLTKGNVPRIRIDGHETDVVLIPSNTSRLGDRPSYVLGGYDRFNSLHPLKNVTNPQDQVVRFSPLDLSDWAPDVNEKKLNDTLRKVAQEIAKQEYVVDEKELDAAFSHDNSTSILQGLSGGAASPMAQLRFLQSQKPESSDKKLAEIMSYLTKAAKPKSKEGVRDAVANADNVGIDSDTISQGNIDLNDRPNVRRENGKISTVDSIGIEQDGKHYVIPQISDDGKVLTSKEAIDLFRKTGKHLGVFKTQKAADKFAKELHEKEEKRLKGAE